MLLLLRTPTPSPADPSTISGMISRYQADQITGVADGGNVALWPDNSGNNYTAVQNTASGQPSFAVNAINGRAAVRWATTNTSYLTSPAPTGSPTQTVAMVVRPSAAAISSTSTIRGTGNDAGLQARLQNGIPNNVAENVVDLGSSTTTLTGGTAVVIITTYDAAVGSTWRVNGTAAGTSSTVYGLDTNNSTLIGANRTNSEYWHGDIAEIIHWGRVLTVNEQATVDSWVQYRYGIQVSDYTNPTTTGDIKVWNGNSFVAKPVKSWNGTAWVKKPVKTWTGSAWKPTNY